MSRSVFAAPDAPNAPRRLLLAVAALCTAAVAAALYSQHALGMMPCPWCILQRIIFMLVGLLALLAALTPRPLQLAATLLALALCAAGLAAALWQHFVAAASQSCNLTLADRIIGGLGLDAWSPEVFGVWASCADAKVSVIGLPYEFYSGALFVFLAGLLVASLRALRRGGGQQLKIDPFN